MFISLIRNNCFHPYESVKHWAHQILKLFKIEENVYVHGKNIYICQRQFNLPHNHI